MEIGHTYVVLVPHRLPIARYPARRLPGTPMWVASLLAGTRFRITVTGIDRDTTPATAEGLRVIERSHTDIALTDTQAIALGLPAGQGYRIVGMLVDRTGRPARVPSLETIQVPVRWLYPPDDPRLQHATHRDADQWPFM